jgi:CheY-like chemotaxis protein
MKTILYVEDDEHDVFFLKRAFANYTPGVLVQNVLSVEEATNYLQGVGAYGDRSKFPSADVIVSDVSIPGGSGYQLLAWVRAHGEVAKLPFILLTGSAQDIQAEKAMARGADFCLEKSTDFKELLAKVTSVLERD